MAHIHRQRDIFSRKKLIAQLDELGGWSGYGSKTQPRVLEIFKEALKKGKDEIRHRFEKEAYPGSEVIRANAFLIDHLVRTIHDFTLKYVYPVANPTTGEQVSIAAIGGYGRGELAPFSDIDLLFLLPYKRTPHTEQVVEYMLYLLWDMGLNVGQATRSVDDNIRLAREDMTIRTSLLESRWLWGDEELYRQFKDRFANEIVAESGAGFVEAKLAERDARHERMGDSRYTLEPNVKEGKGGLRDLQTLFWIAKYLYRVDNVEELVDRNVLTGEDARRFAKAENFLWTVRCHLHYLSGRAEERLGFDFQEPIGRRMAYTDHAGTLGVERFMKHYFLVAKDVGDLTRILCAVLEEQNQKRQPRFRFLPRFSQRRSIPGFRIDGDRLTVEDDNDFTRDPVKLIRLFHEAQRHRIDIHPQALRLVTQNLKRIDANLRTDPEANRLFMEMLTSRNDPEKALRRLNEAGVFGGFIPDFGRVVAQMQYDMYHVFTVDEHTIRAIGILHRIEEGKLKDDHPVASSVIGEVQSRQALYLSVLLHDIAKGRGGDHSAIGSRIAEKLGPRLGLSDWETETVAWLVRHHLLMSNTAFKRDIFDPKAVSDFVDIVQSPERLRLLLILTVVDIRAVGPGVWNGWKAGLLRELYYRALEEMAGGLPAGRKEARVEKAKAELRERLKGWNADEIEDHISLGYTNYWLIHDVNTHVRHADLIREAERQGLDVHIGTRVDSAHDVTEITIYTIDFAGLFANIAGAIALCGANIVDAKLVTMANGMALDTLWIQDARGRSYGSPEKLEKLAKMIRDSLSGLIQPARELEKARRRTPPSRTRVFKVAPRVLIDNKASAHHTIIEVNGRDRLGFLHDVASTLTALGVQITSGHISTYGERVVDVFYVKNVFGLKVDHEEKIKEIRERLLQAVTSEKAPESSPPGDTEAAQ